MHPGGPFSIPAIKNYIPEKVKPWILILFVVIFQFAGGGVYLATLNHVVGGESLLQEDVLMAGYAGLIGMSLTFTIMLRLKLRFLSKHIFMVTALGLITCNIICLYTSNVFVLVAACFIAGILRMWATFECNSSVQLWITPTRDLSVFFCYVYLIVQGSILLSGSTQLYIAYFATWQYIHLFVIGALLFVVLVVLLIFNSNRFMRPFPLFGIDWLGMFLWGMIMLCINFIAVYGEHYDWWQSEEIRTATVLFVVLLALNLYRASFIRHPFISLQTFKFKIVWVSMLIYLLVDFFISPSHLIEEIYLHGILHYDAANTTRINMIGLIGVVVGSVFAYFYFARAKKSLKSTFMIGFSCIVVYLMLMYFFLDYNTSMEMFGLAVFFRNLGYVIIAIALITSLLEVPFPNFFQSITAQTIVSAACGSAVCGAVLHHMFSHTMTKNFQLLSLNMDRVNLQMKSFAPGELIGMMQKQSLLVTFKEIYGMLIICALIMFVLLLFIRNPYLKINMIRPKNKAFRKLIKREMAEVAAAE